MVSQVIRKLVVFQPEQYFLDLFRRSIVLNPWITSNKHRVVFYYIKEKTISFLQVCFHLTYRRFLSELHWLMEKTEWFGWTIPVFYSHTMIYLFVHKWNYKVWDEYLYGHKGFTNVFLADRIHTKHLFELSHQTRHWPSLNYILSIVHSHFSSSDTGNIKLMDRNRWTNFFISNQACFSNYNSH